MAKSMCLWSAPTINSLMSCLSYSSFCHSSSLSKMRWERTAMGTSPLGTGSVGHWVGLCTKHQCTCSPCLALSYSYLHDVFLHSVFRPHEVLQWLLSDILKEAKGTATCLSLVLMKMEAVSPAGRTEWPCWCLSHFSHSETVAAVSHGQYWLQLCPLSSWC